MAFKKAESKLGKYADLATWNKKGEIKEGDSIEGYYVDSETFTTKHGEMTIYVIETSEALVKVTGQTDIKNKFAEIPLGCKVRLTFQGIVETKNNPLKSYEVEYDEEDKTELPNND